MVPSCLILSSHFHANQASGGSGDTTAVTVYRVLLVFYGNNTLIGNRGGGTSLLSSRMDVRGHVLFHGNVAVFGAGVAMAGRSLVRMVGQVVARGKRFLSLSADPASRECFRHLL